MARESVRRGLCAAAAALLVPAGAVATALPAHAGQSCPNNYVCMWEDPGYNGSLYVKQYKTSGYYQIDGWDGDNEISSVKNYTGKCVRLYANDDHTGNSYRIDKNVREISNLEQVGFDNDAESYRIFSC
ncbi:peptidase inhibitor family I36 protein [Thermobifida halotolerans]|uniref:Peptidase inhibitor family I36 protein n=2 Tax=Thermobifida halotolerans TaxID=483545 RepID=A0AA97M0H1_9ACTN|nr:peptidase inhibitor family I36 protein [Thermobifida halotolerans]UOE21717.1 peptidase inhibitor family I36 protein [Thermobifida halotolerans]